MNRWWPSIGAAAVFVATAVALFLTLSGARGGWFALLLVLLPTALAMGTLVVLRRAPRYGVAALAVCVAAGIVAGAVNASRGADDAPALVVFAGTGLIVFAVALVLALGVGTLVVTARLSRLGLRRR